MSYDNTNSGAIFKNEKRSKETDPTMNGSINIEGKEYWVNAWTNTSKAGAKYLSLKVRPKEQQVAPQLGDELDDDMPF
jgi:hypothetical protein